MKLFLLLIKEYPGKLALLLLIALAKGFLQVYSIKWFGMTAEGQSDWQSSLAFLALTVSVFFSTRYFFRTMPDIILSAFKNVSLRMVSKIQALPLPALEKIGAERLLRCLGAELPGAGNYIFWILFLLDSLFILFFTYIFFASLSPALAAVGVLSFVPLYFYENVYQKRRSDKLLAEKADASARYESLIGEAFTGFKELRVNTAKRDAFNADLETRLQKTSFFARKHYGLAAQNQTNFMLATMAGIAVSVFFLTEWGFIDKKEIFGMLALSFFLEKTVLALVINTEGLSNMNTAVKSVLQADKEIDAALGKNAVSKALSQDETDWDGSLYEALPFGRSLRFEDVYFTHAGGDFGIGPINLELRRGETVFLAGGNGSGKSTFLKTITGLYEKTDGRISVDGKYVSPHEMNRYRELFAAVFTDFHLFTRLYGLEDAQPERVAKLLKMLNLEGKTKFKDGRFTNMDLSTGQKKRLAVLITFLENKSVYIFDEVAADQDPDQKVFFYETVLDELKKAGKAVLVVSHDEEFFHKADRMLRMENGQLREIQKE